MTVEAARAATRSGLAHGTASTNFHRPNNTSAKRTASLDVPDQHAPPSCALPLLRSAVGFHLSPVWTHRDEGIRTLI
jgi:hypothetical protein